MNDMNDLNEVSTETINKVAYLTLNRAKSLNALNESLINGLISELILADHDPEIGCIVIYGCDRAFVAGADIKGMLKKSFADIKNAELFIFKLNEITKIQKPIIAAVDGYALGGGCELAMACDIIIATERAIFAQPEITLGTIPGLGGTQRLVRAIGKAKAMDLILSGRHMTATEAEQSGLVSRIVPKQDLHSEVSELAQTIAYFSQPVVKIAKQAVNIAAESHLSQGLTAEKHLFEATFALDDRTEGMTAFTEKRQPSWNNS